MSRNQYSSTYLVGTITADNDDGTYDVKIKGRSYVYASVTGGDMVKYTVGDSVNMMFPQGDRNMPVLLGQATFRS